MLEDYFLHSYVSIFEEKVKELLLENYVDLYQSLEIK